jgi:uncharacterized protein YbjT (DUF2867 family)
MTRDAAKPEARSLLGTAHTEIVKGDLNDSASISRALEDVYGVYSVQTWSEGGVEAEIRQGVNLADAANRAGISNFVYSSVSGADQDTGVPHFDSKFKIEQHLRGTGLPFTILRPVFFMENWLSKRNRLDEHTIALPLRPDTRLQMIAVDDIGAVAAMAFEHPGHWQGRTVDLAGDEMSMTEIAQALSRAEGHNLRYVQVPWGDFEQKAGSDISRMFRWIEEHGYHADISALRQEYSRLLNFEGWLHSKLQPA